MAAVSELTQKYRTLAIKSPLGEDILLFHRMRANEQLGQLFEYELEVFGKNDTVDFAKLLGESVTVEMELLVSSSAGAANSEFRYFNGIVSEIAQVTSENRHNVYRLILRPWLWFLTRTNDCRIFQNQSVPEIIKAVLKEGGFSEFKDRLNASYRTRKYCVQYRESDYDFISRLLQEEGIYYYFTHEDGLHTLVFADDSQGSHDPVSGYEQIPYYPPDSHDHRERDHIFDWSVRQKLQSGKVALNDYDFIAPRKVLLNSSQISRKHTKADYEIYDYPGEYKEPGDGETYSRVRIEELQTQHELTNGRGNARGLTVGAHFTLTKCPRADQNRKYLVVSAQYECQSDTYESQETVSIGPVYECKFTAIDAERPYRPLRTTPRPIVKGPQTAVVVGPDGEEIWTDEYGRVKCQFHWDRYGKSDDNSSCWIRVSHPWAGKNWGAVSIPRIGQEVIVDFLEGDPDQPIITGRVYNADQMPPYGLPANKTQTGIKTRSSKGGSGANFNEVRFEDKMGSEQLFIHAEKNQDIEVENDETHWVGHDRSKTIDNDETSHIKHDRTETVDNHETITIGVNRTEKVGSNENIAIGQNRIEQVGANENITVVLNRGRQVGANENISIGMNRGMQIGGNESTAIAGSRSKAVGGGESINVKKDQSVSIGGVRTQSIATNDALTVGEKLNIIAGDEISIVTGDSSIIMKKDGTIIIQGKDILIKGSGDIQAKASNNVIIKGKKIAEN